MNNLTLQEKVREETLNAGAAPSETVISVDVSNVVNWTVKQLEGEAFEGYFERNHDSEDEPEGRYRVSLALFAEHFSSLDARPYVRVYNPETPVTNQMAEEVGAWARFSSPEIVVNSVGFDSANDLSKKFLADAIREYLTGADKSRINRSILAKMNVLMQSGRWAEAKILFERKGFEVITKSFGWVGKPLDGDNNYSSAVGKIVEGVNGIRKNGNEGLADLKDLEIYMRHLEERLRSISVAVDKSEEIFDALKVKKSTVNGDRVLERAINADEGLEVYALLIRLRSKIHNALQAGIQIEDGLRIPSTKNDFDAYIAARTLEEDILQAFSVFVFYSGDGDFIPLYENLLRRNKRVIVACPSVHLNKNIIEMAHRGELVVHEPDSGDDIWVDRI